jgi:hypothetical protein
VTTLRLIGYWRSDEHPDYPDPAALVDPAWDDQERHAVSLYVANGTVSRAYRGWSPCRFCGKNNGDSEFTDGVYAWPSGLVHYLDDHAVRLPSEFVRHAFERLDEIESSTLDLTWWLAETRS